jgi:nucleoid-associated protein YgaU
MGIRSSPRNHLYLLASFLAVLSATVFFGRNSTAPPGTSSPTPGSNPGNAQPLGNTRQFAQESRSRTQAIRCLNPIPSPPLPIELQAVVFRSENQAPETRLTVIESHPENRDPPNEHFVAITPEVPPEITSVTTTVHPLATSTAITNKSARRHRIVEGDTLEQIAQQYYRSSALANAIFEANRDQLQQPDVLPLGVRLILPQINSTAAVPSGESPSQSELGNAGFEPQTELVPIQRP